MTFFIVSNMLQWNMCVYESTANAEKYGWIYHTNPSKLKNITKEIMHSKTVRLFNYSGVTWAPLLLKFWHLTCLFNSLFALTGNFKLLITGRGIPAQRASNAERFSRICTVCAVNSTANSSTNVADCVGDLVLVCSSHIHTWFMEFAFAVNPRPLSLALRLMHICRKWTTVDVATTTKPKVII